MTEIAYNRIGENNINALENEKNKQNNGENLSNNDESDNTAKTKEAQKAAKALATNVVAELVKNGMATDKAEKLSKEIEDKLNKLGDSLGLNPEWGHELIKIIEDSVNGSMQGEAGVYIDGIINGNGGVFMAQNTAKFNIELGANGEFVLIWSKQGESSLQVSLSGKSGNGVCAYKITGSASKNSNDANLNLAGEGNVSCEVQAPGVNGAKIIINGSANFGTNGTTNKVDGTTATVGAGIEIGIARITVGATAGNGNITPTASLAIGNK